MAAPTAITPIYVASVYTDGTPLWGQTGDFSCGTHDWELREFSIIPQKPIWTLSLYGLLRGSHSGQVWFEDVTVEGATDGAASRTGRCSCRAAR